MRIRLFSDFSRARPIIPRIVIVIDDFADLFNLSGRNVEDVLTAVARSGRAVGVHLVIATQRPTVDIMTGTIKASFPTRIALRVASKIESRIILDSNGAEDLHGNGDMLFSSNLAVTRVHGAYVSEQEIRRVVDHTKSQGRWEHKADPPREVPKEESDESPGRLDPLFFDALQCVVRARRGTTVLIQRHLRIGYGRAAAILDAMVKEGYLGKMDETTRARPVLAKAMEDHKSLSLNDQRPS